MSANARYQSAVAAFNRGDASGFASLYAAGAVVFDPLYPQPLRGRDAIGQDVRDVMRAFPDARFDLSAVLQSGETVAVQYRLRGTHSGPLATPEGEIGPTGREFEILGAVFSRVGDNDEVLQERRFYDVAGLLAQLGITR